MTSLLVMLLSMAAVLALAWWTTRWIALHSVQGVSGGEGGLGILCQISLGRGERLVLVRLGKRCLLLGVTAGGINLLTELTEEEAACWAQKNAAPGFLEALRENLKKRA